MEARPALGDDEQHDGLMISAAAVAIAAPASPNNGIRMKTGRD
jgi:hypothetical protein